MSAITINRILELDGPTSEIIGYLQDPQLSLVSKAFRRANQEGMAQTGKRIAMRDKGFAGKVRDAASDICGDAGAFQTLLRLYNKVSIQINEIPLPPDDQRSAIFRTGLDKMEQLYQRCMQEADPQEQERRAERFVLFLSKIEQVLAAFPREENFAAPDALAQEQNRLISEFCCEGKKFIASERVAERVRAGAFSFSALHASQLESAAFSLAQCARLAQLEARSFAAERFRAAEEIVFDAEFEGDVALSELWSDLRPIINAGPAQNAPAAAIRAWMNDDQNRDALGQVEWLRCQGLHVCPPEIGRLHALRNLELTDGTMSALPREIENLSNLVTVDLRDQQFREVPEVLGRLPGFTGLNFGNNPELRTIPDAFASNFFGWRGILVDAVTDGLWIFPGFTINQFDVTAWRDQHFFGAREQVTDVSFGLWFRDRFSIPHVPLMAAFPVAFAEIYLLARYFLPTLDALAAISYLLYVPAFFLTAILFAPLSYLALALLLLDLPILAWNAFIGLAIQPLVTEVRSALDCGRMIHLRDEPVAEAEQGA